MVNGAAAFDRSKMLQNSGCRALVPTQMGTYFPQLDFKKRENPFSLIATNMRDHFYN